MKIWNNKINWLLLLALAIVLFNCSENNEPVQDTNKQINMSEEDSLTPEIEKDLLTEESLEDRLSIESEEQIIQLTERFKPTSLDMIKSLKSKNELYIKLMKYHPQITQKEKIVNNLFLKQTLFKQMDREDRAGDHEQFLVSELYYYIEANPNKVDNYDEEIIMEIPNSRDSCDKHFFVG